MVKEAGKYEASDIDIAAIEIAMLMLNVLIFFYHKVVVSSGIWIDHTTKKLKTKDCEVEVDIVAIANPR